MQISNVMRVSGLLYVAFRLSIDGMGFFGLLQVSSDGYFRKLVNRKSSGPFRTLIHYVFEVSQVRESLVSNTSHDVFW